MLLQRKKVSPALSEEAQLLYRSLKRLPQLDSFRNPVTRDLARKIQNAEWADTRKELDFSYDMSVQPMGGIDGIRMLTKGFREDGPVILYLHAGGFVCGSPESNAGAVLPLCHLTGGQAFGVRYRLAPEHPFPAAWNDATAYYKTLLENIPEGKRIIAVGDSAGGNLLLSSLVRWRDEGIRLPDKAVLISPVLDGSASSDTMLTVQKHDPLIQNKGGTSISNLFRHYANGTDVNDPRISPLNADLSGLPPLMIQVGSREVLLGDSARLSQRAISAGNDVRLRVLDGMFHMFHLYWNLPETKAVYEDMANFALY